MAEQNTENKVLYDRDIREPLFEFLEDKFGKVRIFEEKQIGSVRADVVMVTPDALIGIEIKSDADTYTRLKKQVESYDKFYDYNILVVGSTHAMHAKDHVPEWWGIITVEPLEEGGADFYVLREAVPNPMVDDKCKIAVLWRPELNNIIDKCGLPAYRRMSKQFVRDKLLEKVDGKILWPLVYEELFERDYTKIASVINEYRKTIKQKPRRRKSGARLRKKRV